RGEQVRILPRPRSDLAVDHPPRLQRPSGGGAIPGGGVIVRVAFGIEQSGGLHLVVLPAQSVEVPQTRLPALPGLVVVVFDDVVILRRRRGRASTSWDGAVAVAQSQLEPHL